MAMGGTAAELESEGKLGRLQSASTLLAVLERQLVAFRERIAEVIP